MDLGNRVIPFPSYPHSTPSSPSPLFSADGSSFASRNTTKVLPYYQLVHRTFRMLRGMLRDRRDRVGVLKAAFVELKLRRECETSTSEKSIRAIYITLSEFISKPFKSEREYEYFTLKNGLTQTSHGTAEEGL